MQVLLVSVWMAFAAPQGEASSGVIALEVDKVMAEPGQLLDGGYVVIRDGRIEHLNATSAPEGAWVMRFPGGIATAGLVDPVTALGASGQLTETARAFTPEAKARDSFHAAHSEFRKAAQGGITLVGVSPDSRNVVGGLMAVAYTSSGGGVASLAGDGPLRLALTRRAFQWDREPTSRMGALPELREMAGGGLPGEGALVLDADTPDEVRLGAQALSEAERQLVVLGSAEADEAIEVLKASNATVVLGPYPVYSSTRQLRQAALLHEAGVPVALTGHGDPALLRLSAAMAVREGLPAEQAWAAVTTVPAAVLGAPTGTLATGQRADVVVWSGDPLDLASRVEAVLVGGAPVDLEEHGHEEG